ncbi:heat shock 70 kDa protein 12B-like [Ruditapes philippinarum]|uniref:heat shock 70 kDa protein 12B-like n=1 Tax=Ruditapes philippinarum TaxID=129788 RepID=UPI00295AF5A3|nr:heat shock 70 kDa protein 12B-like [Ruditapes philippinarum]
MLTEENEYYIRIILLLCGGCLYVTKRFLEQELKKNDEKLDDLLKKKRGKLRHELHKKQVERLFPNDRFDNTDIDTWDIQMILCVLLHVLNKPDSKEKKLIKELKKYRNDIIAHRATTTLNKKDFDTFQSDIQNTMKHLASKCDRSVQERCDMLICSSLTGQLDKGSADKYSQELAESEEKLQEIIDKFESLPERIKHLDENTWKTLNEILNDLIELKSYMETASMELKNLIGVSKEGLDQLEDSLENKIRAHIQKQDPSVRESVEPSDLTKVGQATSVPHTTQIEKNTSFSPKSKSVEEHIIAAIDIGTALSGCAFYCSNRTYITHWLGHFGSSQKTPTCILFDSNKKFHSFGFEAEDKYASLPEETDDYMNWFFFRHFKMQLYKIMPVKRFVTVDGKEMDAMGVMSATIMFFREKVLEDIERRFGVDYSMYCIQKIRWILTVPAIWTDSAKQFMRKAAIRAGIQTDELRIALEPEVAGIYCLCEGTRSILAASGDKCIVVDMGGGTVDITPLAFEHHEGFKIHVLHTPCGCACGSKKVDAAFFKLIEYLVGELFFSKFCTENRWDHIDFQRDFERIKLRISNETDDITFINFKNSMLHRYQEEIGDVNEAIKKSAYRENISYSRGRLRISSDTLKSLFKPCSDQIIQHIDDVLRTVSRDRIKAIILTGGFSESSLMQNAIARAFPNLKVLVPESPIEAVLRGAVLYGLTPHIITQRVSKYTYGIEISPLFDASIHDESRRVVICGKERCKKVFRKFVGIGEVLSLDTKVCQEHSTIVPYQEKVGFRIVCSDSPHPMYTDDTGVLLLGTLHVSLPPEQETSDFNVQFRFGGTEIVVTSVDLKSQEVISGTFNFLG